MVTVSYHTDPACPWSWGAEPAIRKLMTERGMKVPPANRTINSICVVALCDGQ